MYSISTDKNNLPLFIGKLTTKLIYHEKSIDHICCFGLNRLCIIL